MIEGPPRFRKKVKVGGDTEAEVFCADEQRRCEARARGQRAHAGDDDRGTWFDASGIGCPVVPPSFCPPPPPCRH